MEGQNEKGRSRVVALQMAECLAAAEVDLCDLDAVVATLGRHNFGSASIAHCLDGALEIAGKGK